MALALSAAGPVSALPGAARLLSVSAAVVITLEEQLSRAPWLRLLTIPGYGRGLFATQGIEQGSVVHEEAPMLCAPSPHALRSTCHHCLRPLPLSLAASHNESSSSGGSTDGTSTSSSGGQPSGPPTFCSPQCSSAAGLKWAAAAADCDFQPLHRACRESGEKLPLMLARLACAHAQHQQVQHLAISSSNFSACSSATARGEAEAEAGAGNTEGCTRGDPLTQLRHLCYANLAQAPQPWVDMHQQLLHSLQPLLSANPQLHQVLSLSWYCDAMARLHLNNFRVDTVPPLDASDPSALLRAAAASLATSSAPAHHTGSAAYLLASMLNHSCEPNLDISFPYNNGVARFTAARDIAANEQLNVSYIDVGQGLAARRQALEWSYGFTCHCPRCLEEEEEE